MENKHRLRLVDTSATVCQFHLLLHRVNPPVWRRLLMRGDHTLADLHFAIQLAMDWSDEHLHLFKIRGKDYSVPRAYGLGGMDATPIRLRDLSFRPRERFLYKYDFMDWWRLQVRFEKDFVLQEGKTYPVCIGGSRAAPPEDCGGAWTYMEMMDEHRFNFPWDDAHLLGEAAERMLKDGGKDAEAAIGDRVALEDAVDRVREYYAFRPDRFNRRKVNRRLRDYAHGDPRWQWQE